MSGLLLPIGIAPFFGRGGCNRHYLAAAIKSRSGTASQSPPICVVTEPDLCALAGTSSIPHIYRPDKHISGTRLCLFLPSSQTDNKLSEWRSQQKISETLIPWASLWLFYFEQWLHTGHWEGGGKHPRASEVKNER